MFSKTVTLVKDDDHVHVEEPSEAHDAYLAAGWKPGSAPVVDEPAPTAPVLGAIREDVDDQKEPDVKTDDSKVDDAKTAPVKADIAPPKKKD